MPGYEAKFVQPLLKRHECPICLLAIRNAVQIECGHLFCRECFDPVLRSRRPICPIDKEEISAEGVFPDRGCQREILNLEVYCNHMTGGCNWTGHLKELDEHSAGCEYRDVQCTHCSQFVQQLSLKEHQEKDCPMRPGHLDGHFSGADKPKAESEVDERILSEALKEGVVKCKTMTVAITGHAGVGKTSTLRYILDEDPPETRNSTSVIDGPFRAVSISHQAAVTGHKLKQISDGSILRILFNARQEPDPQVHVVKEPHTDQVVQGNQQGATAGSTNQLAEDIDRLIPELTQHFQNSPGDVSKAEFFFFLDSGGQPEYQEIFPSLVENLHVNIVVVNLSEGLEKHPTTELFKNGKCIGKHVSRYSNKEILRNSIHTTQNLQTEYRTLVIGTHVDDPNSEKNKKEINKELQEMLDQGEVNENELICYHGSSIIFPINAMERKHDREIQTIRNKLLKCMEKVNETEVPIRWFGLRQLLCIYCKQHQRNLQIVSKKTYKETAKKLKIEDRSQKDALKNALRFLRKHKLLLYFPDGSDNLPELVFCEPQPLLKPINDLVQGAYYASSADPTCNYHPEGKEVQVYGLLAKESRELREMGIVPKDFFQADDLKSQFNDLFTLDEFFRIATHLGIAAKSTNERYMFPFLLDDLGREEVQEFRDHCEPYPLLVYFDDDAAPQKGTFTTLITNLIKDHQWKELEPPKDMRKPKSLRPHKDEKYKRSYRNCMQFHLDGKCGSVVLIKPHAGNYFEVHTIDSESNSAVDIKNNVFKALPNAKPGFFCETCKGGQHLAKLMPAEGNVRCLMTSKPIEVSCCAAYHKWMDASSRPPGERVKAVRMSREEPWKLTLLELRSTLANVIEDKSSPDRFSDELIGKGFITEEVKKDRVNVLGLGNYSKISRLLDAVSTDINNAGNKAERFNDFVSILTKLGLDNIAKQLTDCCRKRQQWESGTFSCK